MSLLQRVCKAQPIESVSNGNKTLDESLSSQLQDLPKLSLLTSQSLKKPPPSSLNKSLDDELDRILNGDPIDSDDDDDLEEDKLISKPVTTTAPPVNTTASLVTVSKETLSIASNILSTTTSSLVTANKPVTTQQDASVASTIVTSTKSKSVTSQAPKSLSATTGAAAATVSDIKSSAKSSLTSDPLTLSPVKPSIRQSLPPLGSLPPLAPPGNTKQATTVFPSALESNQSITIPKPSGGAQPPIDEYSLKEEPLSELDEDLSLSSDDDDNDPLMNSDQLKAALDNMKMVSSDDEDYNKLPDEKYKKMKEEMDKEFEQLRSKPTDPDFVYDKEEDYGKPVMESGWDTHSSSSSSVF